MTSASPSDRQFQAAMQYAMGCLRSGRLIEAEEAYRRILKAAPNYSQAYQNLGLCLMLQNKLTEADLALRRCIAIEPDHSHAHYHLGEILERQNKFEDAEIFYRKAVGINSNLAEAWHNIGSIKLRQGRYDEAELMLRHALSLKPQLSEAHTNLGTVLSMMGRHEEAIQTLRTAVCAQPDNPQAYNNLGIALCSKGDFDGAIESYTRAIAIFPSYEGAYINLGIAYKERGDLEKSEVSYLKAIAINSDNAPAHYHLGMLLCELDRLEEAFAAYQRHAKLAYGKDSFSQAKLSPEPHKVQHDGEQKSYLKSQVLANNGILTHSFYLADGSRAKGPAIQLDISADEIEQRWRQSRPQIVIVDNFLTEEALARLRNFCWQSTIWQKVYREGYLGAMPEHGFACPLIAQIAMELRGRLPQIFDNHPLLQFWAFKYDSRLNGIKLHADFAAINVNFWITPDEANLDPNTGGLVIWDVAAPTEWSFVKYNKSAQDIERFLIQKNAKPFRVPYKANRAVIFDSDLFHETDQIQFKDGYLNRRINVTFLYGRREISNRQHDD